MLYDYIRSENICIMEDIYDTFFLTLSKLKAQVKANIQ